MIYAFKWTVLIHYANDYHLTRCAGIFNIIGCCCEELWKKDAETGIPTTGKLFFQF